ncbi:MAG: helix-hairpin-helix domain-containing protein [Planctomycetes bacterium]|nr:helix-hairpin-helix domain-containing protein [Planctomycetota bacterium]
MRRLSAFGFVVLGLAGASAAKDAPAPAAAPPADKAAVKDAEKKAPKEIVIKAECGVLEDVFRHRAALHYLKNENEAREAILKGIDPESAGQVKQLIEKDEAFTDLDYHFLEKIKNCEQRILNRLRVDKFNGVEDLLEAVKGKNYPTSVAYANLLNTVEMNFRYAQRKGLVTDAEFVKSVGPRLTAEQVRIQGTAGHSTAEVAKETWKDGKPDDFPVYWFDPSSGTISYPFGEVPDAPGFPKIDLNTASRDDIVTLPEVESEIADAVLKYRKKTPFQGVEELRFIKEVPAHLVEPLQSLCTASQVVKKKAWTVMVYLNAANNLEPFGIEDMNEMERVGSTNDVNIVVECARFKGHPDPRPNPAYFSNPFQEHETVFYWGLDNAPGTRRYYILKDDDKVRVRSVLKQNVGDTDAGRPEPLANFGKWAVENYPADHYALVIWNHGAGWSGVSYDDNSHHGMDLPEVRQACEGICDAITKAGGKHIDVIDFDACLMATVEVAYELRDVCDYLASSQETEPGDGMPYDDYLEWLTKYPESSAVSLSKAMVDTYVKSYAPHGSQSEGEDGFDGAETKCSIRLSRIAALRDAVEDVAGILEAKPEVLGEVAEEIVKESRRFGRLVDIQDFFGKLVQHEKSDAALKAAVDKAIEIISYPNEGQDALVNEVVIQRRSAGNVIWGWNGWLTPPRSLAPWVHESRLAKTPLVGPDEKGNFVAKIKFPPMLSNPKTKKPEFVKEINYRFDDDPEKRSISDFKNTFITTDFPSDAAVAAEGHLVGNNRSHGISLYFPAYLGFDKEYRRLRFADGSKWAKLCEKFPLKKLDKPQAVGLLGVNHATKADREKLGAIVVKEEFDKAIRKYDFAAPLSGDLKKLGLGFDCIKDPKPYGEDWLAMAQHFANGTAILDNHLGGETGASVASFMEMMFGGPSIPKIVGPDGRTVMRYLQSGGHLLLSTPGATAAIWDTPLYRDTLGLEYEQKWDYTYTFNLKSVGVKADDTFEIEPARKGEGIVTFTARGTDGVEPFAMLLSKDGGKMIGAKIARTDPTTGKAFKAVVLGFYLTDIKGDDQRLAVLREAMTFLSREPLPMPAPGLSAAPTPAAGDSGGQKQN